jgi:hypothetical protein
MQRRRFFTGSACLGGSTLARACVPLLPGGARAVRIGIDLRRQLGAIPEDFIGLGYEVSSVAVPGLLSDGNPTCLRLLRGLSATGVIRIGGATSDSALYAADGPARAAANATVVSAASLRDLGGFLAATGWRLIWGLNLGRGTPADAAEEAAAVAAAVGDRLLAFEIGNEPDLFATGSAPLRPGGYDYAAFLAEYRRFKSAVRARLPGARFAGPDVAAATDWLVRFAADEGGDLALLTQHYYRGPAHNLHIEARLRAAPSFSAETQAAYERDGRLDRMALLLHPDPALATMLQTVAAAAARAKVPFRICETNSFFGGGQPGVSDTLGGALWTLDYLHTLAATGAAGVNIETGINQLGFVSFYSPILNDPAGNVTVGAPYYGMLAFAQAARGRRLTLDPGTNDGDFAAYASFAAPGELLVTLVNKKSDGDVDATLAAALDWQRAEALRLTGPSLASTEGIELGGAAVGADGAWRAARAETLPGVGGTREIRVPAASAAIVRWRP